MTYDPQNKRRNVPPQNAWGPRQQPPPYPPQPYPPQYGPPPPRKSSAGKVIAFGCLGMVLIVVLVIVVAILLVSGHPNPAGGA